MNPIDAILFAPLLMSLIVQRILPSDFSTNKKVFFQPPGYVFGIVWTILYVLMGVYFRNTLQRKGGQTKHVLLTLLVLNLCVNLAWTPVVNNMRRYTTGVYMIGVMLLLTLSNLVIDDMVWNKAMLVPYFTWLLFALLLNIELARLYETK